MSLTLNSIVSATPQQLTADLGQSLAILHLPTQRYHTLQGSGMAVWMQLREPVRVADLLTTLTLQFEVEPGRCQAEVLDLLERLAAAGLLDVVPPAGVDPVAHPDDSESRKESPCNPKRP